MKVTPRKTEISAVIEVLQSEDHESPEAAAKAVIRRVAELLGERSWRIYAHRYPGRRPMLFGPLPTAGAVEKFAQSLKLDGEHLTAWLHSPSAALRLAESADQPPSWHCASCQHPIAAHGVLPGQKEACSIKGCDCEAPTSS